MSAKHAALLFLIVVLSSCSGDRFFCRKYLDGKYSEKGASGSVVKVTDRKTAGFIEEDKKMESMRSCMDYAPEEFNSLRNTEKIKNQAEPSSNVQRTAGSKLSKQISPDIWVHSIHRTGIVFQEKRNSVLKTLVSENGETGDKLIIAALISCLIAAALFSIGLLMAYSYTPLFVLGYELIGLGFLSSPLAAVFASLAFIKIKREGENFPVQGRFAIIASYLLFVIAFLFELYVFFYK